MNAKDVFTPGGLPTVTYVDDHLVEKRQQFLDVLDAGQSLISISGPSKSGKTVFVEQVLGRGNIVQITGAGINSSTGLWSRVFDAIGTPKSRTILQGRSSSISATAFGEVSGGIVVAKGKGGISGTGSYTKNSEEISDQVRDDINLLIDEFSESKVAIFIDDFHYIGKEIQVELAQQIKEVIRNGVIIICASTPYHSDDVLRGNPDLMGRVYSIDFDYWNRETLTKIAHLGFLELGIHYEDSAINCLASEAAGSPQLMQYLCLNTCYELGIRVKGPERLFQNDSETLTRICKRTSITADYSSVLECMKDGPKTRGSDRKIYSTRFGWQGDVYKVLAKALSLDPPQLTIRYPDLSDRISRVCAHEIPSGSSITSSCHHSAAIINSKVGQTVVEWDSENDVFDIRDPYFLFFLRWAEAVD